MRHAVSLLVSVGLAVLALGSSSSEPSPVQGRIDGPDEVVAGQAFPFTVHLDNGSDAPVTVEHVVVSGDAIRALGVRLPAASATQSFGDGVRYTIAAVTVAPGSEARIAEFEGTPYLSGYRSEGLELCASDGICHDVTLSTRVKGGADEAITSAWTLPEQVTVGEPFEIGVTLKNSSGGDDIVQTLGLDSKAAEWLEIRASEPPHQGPGEALLREVWRYDLGLAPGDEVSVTWTAVASRAGTHTVELAVCTASETFCADVEQELAVVAAGDTDGDTDAATDQAGGAGG